MIHSVGLKHVLGRVAPNVHDLLKRILVSIHTIFRECQIFCVWARNGLPDCYSSFENANAYVVGPYVACMTYVLRKPKVNPGAVACPKPW